MSRRERHYLEAELYDLVRSDDTVFDFLQRGSLDGMWYWDLDEPAHEWMSPGFWELLGYDPADKKHLAAEWQDLIHPDDLQTAIRNLERHTADPRHPYDQVVRYRHRDGSTVWVRCRGLAIRDEQGKPNRLLGAHSDITELKRTEQELRAALVANRELEQFAYLATHDLREPLRTVVAYLDLLEAQSGAQLDDDARAHIRVASSASRRMQRLLSALLDYARGADAPVQKRPVEGVELVRRAIENLSVLISESGARVTHGDLPVVYVSESEAELVLQNLVANAIQHGGEDRIQVHITGEVRGGYVVIHVQDDGQGIPLEEQERIFRVFQRLARTDDGSVGIGLPNARQLVERHGGTLWVTSSPGEGARFSFSLPSPVRAASGSGLAPDAASRTAWTSDANPKAYIVMVDDSEPEIRLAEECYRRSRVQRPWRCYKSGRSFLGYLEQVAEGRESMPALVLMDINMPDRNGLDVLAEVKQVEAFRELPPFIMLTNSRDPSDRAKAEDLGAIGLQVKPESVAEYVDFFDSLAGVLPDA